MRPDYNRPKALQGRPPEKKYIFIYEGIIKVCFVKFTRVYDNFVPISEQLFSLSALLAFSSKILLLWQLDGTSNTPYISIRLSFAQEIVIEPQFYILSKLFPHQREYLKKVFENRSIVFGTKITFHRNEVASKSYDGFFFKISKCIPTNHFSTVKIRGVLV